ncbi:hypothetical protein AAMO2058_000510400 [Amorphochlora amoebiformis]
MASQGNEKVDSFYENERYYPLSGWSKSMLPFKDPHSFSNRDGTKAADRHSFPLDPHEWKAVHEWRIVINPSTDKKGWRYSIDFRTCDTKYVSTAAKTSLFRRRRWIRTKRRVQTSPRLRPPAIIANRTSPERSYGSSISHATSAPSPAASFALICQPDTNVGRVLEGDKILLPPSILTGLMTKFGREPLPSPMVFEIRNKRARRISHCGVLEFTAPDKSVAILPSWMLRNLKLTPGETSAFTLRPIPKLTDVLLQPLTSEFAERCDDPVRELTNALEKFTCLTAGDSVPIPIAGKTHTFRIRKVQPERKEKRLPSAGCIIDADIKVGFMEAVKKGSQRIEKIASKSNTDTKRQAQSTNRFEGKGPGVKLSANRVIEASEISGKMCPTCRKDIPKSRFALHEIQCMRLNIWCTECNGVIRKVDAKRHSHCKKCGKVVNKDEMQTHMDTEHKLIRCVCGRSFEANEMESHKSLECPRRQLNCRYCSVKVAAEDKAGHEMVCGGRSCTCRICHERVLRRGLGRHMAVVHKMNPSLLNTAEFAGPEEVRNH